MARVVWRAAVLLAMLPAVAVAVTVFSDPRPSAVQVDEYGPLEVEVCPLHVTALVIVVAVVATLVLSAAWELWHRRSS